jgi:U3 small nucleolar RNA-associated protein 5
MSTKRKLSAKLGQPALKPSAKPQARSGVDESRTVVSGGGQPIKTTVNGIASAIDISSDSSSVGEDDDDEEEPSEDESEAADDQDEPEVEAPAEGADVLMDDALEESGEPSFGELVRANAAEPIDVAAFDAPSPGAQTYTRDVQVQAPSGASLGTVLTQALRTNDVTLLESCLHTTDLNTIRATVQRLESPLAGTLLQKLAERLHRRPGRAGSLMVWVQWTLVTHGGYLATQRDLVKKLAELNRVIDERAKGLPALLSLKGKLDMLEAQIELRRSVQNQRRPFDEDEDDDGVIYVEGQESEEEEAVAKPQRLAANGDLEDISDGESEVSEDMPMTNGRVVNSEDEESESSQDEDDDLIDDEAEETDEDNADENDVDHDDQDEEVDDEESDDGGAPPPKVQRTGLASRRR